VLTEHADSTRPNLVASPPDANRPPIYRPGTPPVHWQRIPGLDSLITGGQVNGSRREDVDRVRANAVPLALRFSGLPGELASMRKVVRDWAAAAGLSGELLEDLQLVVGEAAANAIEHGYRAGRPGSVEVWLSRDEAGAVHGRVRDYGTWRPQPEDPGDRGRGLALIRALATQVSLSRRSDGTEVAFTMPLM
jgi:anti-sigma regulatory factor (Ser/Thr protein kinase)